LSPYPEKKGILPRALHLIKGDWKNRRLQQGCLSLVHASIVIGFCLRLTSFRFRRGQDVHSTL
jgi:hypothetical protein